MTKKHFEAMATYLAELYSSWYVNTDPAAKIRISHEYVGAYTFALYLANTFGTNFDRARFDADVDAARIEKRSKV